jgi:hypothetical protein
MRGRAVRVPADGDVDPLTRPKLRLSSTTVGYWQAAPSASETAAASSSRISTPADDDDLVACCELDASSRP